MTTAIPRLQRQIPIVDKHGFPSFEFHSWHDRHAQATEDHEAAQDAMLADIIVALANMPDIPDVVISADSTGTIRSGQLPTTVSAKRFSGSTDQTTLASWSFTVDSGSLTATISNGDLVVTVLDATSVVTITSSYLGTVRSRTFKIIIQVSEPAVTVSTFSSTKDFTVMSSTAYAVVSPELTVTVGASGTVTLNAPLELAYVAGANTATYYAYAKWQWWNGAAWADVALEALSFVPCAITDHNNVYNGSIICNRSKTGLVPAATEKFRLEGHCQVAAVSLLFIGTASISTS